MVLGLNLAFQDWKTKHFASDVLQKSTLAEIGILMIPRSIFHDFGWPWNQFSCGSWRFWYPNLLFGMLGGFSLASWGTLGRSWDTWEHNKGRFEVQAWFLLMFYTFRNPILKVCWVHWINKCVFCDACFQASFSNCFWVWIWLSRIGKLSKHFCRGSMQKSFFAEVGRLMNPGFIFPQTALGCRGPGGEK